MRIGLVCFGYGLGRRGGVQVYVRELVRALLAHDDSATEYVLIFHPADELPALPPGARASAAKLEGPAAVPRWRRRLSALIRSVPGSALLSDPLARQIDRLDLDIVHFPATQVPVHGLRTAFVLTFFDAQEKFLPQFFSWRERLQRSLVNRRALRGARLVLAPSRFTASSLESRYGVPPARIAVTPAGVGEDFRPEPEVGERERLRERYGIPCEGFLFFPAHPWPHKNHAALFAALRLLWERGRRVPLVCTGSLEGTRRVLGDLAQACGLPREGIIDLGFVTEEDMPALYRAARLLVFPSLFEGFGMPLLEAMACGCPVASSSASCLPEIGGDAVRLFDPGSPAAIADAVEAVLTQNELRASLVGRGLARARELRWERVVPALVEAYRTALRA